MIILLERYSLDLFKLILQYLDESSFRNFVSTCKDIRKYIKIRQLVNIYDIKALSSEYNIRNISMFCSNESLIDYIANYDNIETIYVNNIRHVNELILRTPSSLKKIVIRKKYMSGVGITLLTLMDYSSLYDKCIEIVTKN